MVKWEDNNKNITIIDSEGNKRRLSNIEKEYPKPYPLSRTFLREREKQQFLPEPLLLSFY